MLRYCPLSIVLLLVLVPSMAGAENSVARIGSTEIVIPIPEGYVDTRNTSTVIHDVMSSFVPTINGALAIMLTENDVTKMMEGDDSHLEMYYMLQYLKQLAAHELTEQEFETIISQIRPSVDEFLQQSEAEINNELEASERRLEDISADDVDLQMKGYKVLPDVVDEPGRFTTTLLQQFDTQMAGKKDSFITAATVTYLHLRNKLIYVYVYELYQGPQNILNVQNAADDLISELRRANP